MSWAASLCSLLDKSLHFLFKQEDSVVAIPPLSLPEEYTVGQECWVRGAAFEGGYLEQKQAIVVGVDEVPLLNGMPVVEVRAQLCDSPHTTPRVFYPRWDEITIAKGGFGKPKESLQDNGFFFDLALSRVVLAPLLTAFMPKGSPDWIHQVVWFPCIVLDSRIGLDESGNVQLKVRVPHLGVKIVNFPRPLALCRETFQSGRHPVFTVFDMKPGDAIRAVAGPQTFHGHGSVMRAGGLPATAKPSRYDCDCRLEVGPNAACVCFSGPGR